MKGQQEKPRELYVDCHTHLLPPKRSRKLIEWALKFMPDHPVPLDSTVEDLIADLRGAGVRRWASLYYPIWPDESRGLNRFGAELAGRYPEITAFGGVHIKDPQPLEIVKEAIQDLGMAGLKFHPMVQRFSPAEPRLKPIYPYLNERERAVYIHTGYDEWYGYHLPRQDVEWIISEHPRMGVALSHIGFPRIDWAFGLAEKYPNVWLDTTNVFGSMAMLKHSGQISWNSEDSNEDLAKILANRLPDLAHRTFFGTDHPAGLGDISQILSDMKAFGLDQATQEQILIHTPKNFLKLYKYSV